MRGWKKLRKRSLKNENKTEYLWIKIYGGYGTSKTLQQLREEFSDAPVSQREYMIQGKKFIVTSHYAGNKDLNAVLQKIAENRVYREIGLKK